MGLDLSGYTTTSMSVYNSGQSRGAIADALDAIESDARDQIEQLNQILANGQWANSPALLVPAAVATTQQSQHRQSSTSHDMGS